VFIIIQ